jgi:hypothetical protein
LFISLLSEEDFPLQHTWLLNLLSAATKKWKIVFFHKPFFTTDSHASDMASYISTWWKAFDDYGVDVILNGHSHYYLRAKPINLNISTDYEVSEYGSKWGQGRLQIVAGSYGAPLIPTGNEWFIEENVSSMNYTKFEIIDNLLKMKAYNMSGTMIDSVSINKPIATGIIDQEIKSPLQFKLSQNYPNPFNKETTITYNLTAPGYITLKIVDLSGREIETLVHGVQPAGDTQINWEANGLKSGMYFYRLEVGNASEGSGKRISETKKLILLR